MDKDQSDIVATIRNLGEYVEGGEMPANLLPISEVMEILRYSFESIAGDGKAEKMVQLFHDILQEQMMEQNVPMCRDIMYLMAECMQMWFEREEYYQIKENAIWKSARESVIKSNVLYEEIVEQYKNGKIDELFVQEHTYQSLAEIKERGENNLFKKVAKQVYQVNAERLAKKNRMKILFLVKDSTEWSCEKLYHMLAEREGVEVGIMVAPFGVGTQQTIWQTYERTISFFESKNYTTFGIYDKYQNRFRSWKEIGVPDIVFHLNPHYTAFQESANICNFPLSILNIYIPYGIMIYGNVEHQFNQLSHMLYWKIFCETAVHKEMADKYSDIGDSNVVCSGYVKMDEFFEDDTSKMEDIWKIAPAAKGAEVKKIIYAPHWSIKDAFTGFGNFDKIYKELYEYAKEHAATTSWIFRPHPMLRAGVVEQGLFATEEEFDDYLRMWEELPNARVSEEGTYIDLFKTSDAMVLDSVSFMAEYLYTGKPMLFLTRDRQTFNEFGKRVKEVLYTADGSDFSSITGFISEVVIGGRDWMKEKRAEFYQKYLNYPAKQGKLASEYVLDYIMKQIRT